MKKQIIVIVSLLALAGTAYANDQKDAMIERLEQNQAFMAESLLIKQRAQLAEHGAKMATQDRESSQWRLNQQMNQQQREAAPKTDWVSTLDAWNQSKERKAVRQRINKGSE